jgi:hypothetical protein
MEVNNTVAGTCENTMSPGGKNMRTTGMAVEMPLRLVWMAFGTTSALSGTYNWQDCAANVAASSGGVAMVVTHPSPPILKR